MRLLRHVPGRSILTFFIAITLCFSLISLILTSSFVRAAAIGISTASITLSNKAGPPTSYVKVTGAGFGASETVKVFFDAKVAGKVASSGKGTFVATIKIPRLATPGNHIVKAIGQTSQQTATASFLVQTNWDMSGFGPARTGYNPYENVLSTSNVSTLVSAWTMTLQETMRTSVTIADGRAFISNSNLYAVDAATGTLLWTSPYAFNSAPAVVGGIVYTGSDKLYALKASTGTVLWSASTGNSPIAPVVQGNVVYVDSELTNNVYAFNAQTGKQLWLATTGNQNLTALAVANGIVYVNCSDDNLYAFNAKTGAELWTFTAGSYLNTTPVVANGLVFITAGNDTLYAVNATIGKQVWTASTGIGNPPPSTPAVAGNLVYVGENDLRAFNTTTGALVWTAMSYNLVGTPAVANGVVYTSDNYAQPFISAVNATTGAKLWITSLGSEGSDSSPAIANGILYIGAGGNGSQGTVFAFQLPKH